MHCWRILFELYDRFGTSVACNTLILGISECYWTFSDDFWSILFCISIYFCDRNTI